MIDSSVIFLVIIIVIGLWWCIGFWMVNDMSVEWRKINAKNILVIFPHPDDESLSCGGLLSKLSKQKVTTNLLVLTKGEAGENHLGKGDLKEIRSKEIVKSAKILGVTNLVLTDFGDGKIRENESKVRAFIDQEIERIKPDLVITYDLSGLYGHEDHIVVAEIVTDLIKNKFKNVKLWYTSMPEKVYRMGGLPTHMAKDNNWIMKRKTPNIKVFVGINVIDKIKSVYAHESQYGSFRKEEFKYLPLWFIYSTLVCEYFYENN